jgi:hypothetical protein
MQFWFFASEVELKSLINSPVDGDGRASGV